LPGDPEFAPHWRPAGRPLSHRRNPRPRAGGRSGAGAQPVPLGRARDARLGQRSRQLLGAGCDRRGDALNAACPKGIDVYFDNTSGPISDAVLRRLAVGARVINCGTAPISSWDPIPQGPRVERQLLVKRARMQGFLAFDYLRRYAHARKELEGWVRDGLIRYREDILEGIDKAPDAIAGLYRGDNLGKRLIRVAPELA